MSTTTERKTKAKDEPDATGPIGPPGLLSIHERMVAILGELPAIGKDQRNEQQKFMYRGHDDVMNALNPLLAKHGVYFVPDVLERIATERSTARGSTMYEVNIHVRYTFFGPEGDWVSASAWGEGTDMGDKSTNKAMTMALKNVLAQAFAISTEELSDADGGSPEETTRGQQRQPQTRARGRRERGEFDPALDLLEGAATNTNVMHEQEASIASDLAWPALLQAAGEHVYGERASWDDDAKNGFLRRWSNLLAWIPANAGGLWQPDLGLQGGAEGDAVLMRAIGWAFGGYQPDALARAEKAPLASGDDAHTDAVATSETTAENGDDDPGDAERDGYSG